jgi:uncharacterized membrane protein YcaP (DUF421 family)
MELSELFRVTVSPWELIIRGTAMYLFLFLLFRVVIRRRVGSVGMADILILVIVADASQNAMSGEYKSVTDGAILVGTIIAWTQLIDWLNWRVPALRSWLEPPPLPLIEDGRILRHNLRKEYVTEDELKAKLREQGVDDVRTVAKAHMETDGQISVIKRQPA